MRMATDEYKAFLKTVAGSGEAARCHWPTRLDLYGRGCGHDCRYCYAKGLLEFRGLWHPEAPAVADLAKVERALDGIPRGSVLRLGGLTDCYQPAEREARVTLRALPMLWERGIHALIVTKSDMVAESPWLEALDPELAHVQVSVTSTSDGPNPLGERATAPSRRMAAVRRLAEEGIDVSVRLSPLCPELVDLPRLREAVGPCDKALVEFLRATPQMARAMRGLDLSHHTLLVGGYHHLPLRRKRAVVEAVRGQFGRVSVCEDVPSHWAYWQANVNANPSDCCDLRGVAPEREERAWQ